MKKDAHTGMDIEAISRELYHYTKWLSVFGKVGFVKWIDETGR